MGEALITRRGGFNLENLNVVKVFSNGWSYEANLLKGCVVIPTEVRDEANELYRTGLCVFVDGELIYNDLEFYGYLTITNNDSGCNVVTYSNYSNYFFDHNFVYCLLQAT